MDSEQEKFKKIALWALTPKAYILAKKINDKIPYADLMSFENLSLTLSEKFNNYSAHIFIMSTGIVVRLISPHLKHKTIDPAVVVVDETGKFAISLISGHIGGANLLAKKIEDLIGAKAVITTATDLNNLPAIDVLSKDKNLFIENSNFIKNINMAFIKNEKIYLHDPYKIMKDSILKDNLTDFKENIPVVYIDDKKDIPYSNVLILRPKTLFVGIGCNRNSTFEEIIFFLSEILGKYNLSINSLKALATIDLKKDEEGLIALSNYLKLPFIFFSKEELQSISDIKSPSLIVEKHIGVKNVCESAAILASEMGNLIIPKQIAKNVTVAVARQVKTGS